VRAESVSHVDNIGDLVFCDEGINGSAVFHGGQLVAIVDIAHGDESALLLRLLSVHAVHVAGRQAQIQTAA